jgi:hypothetical protein
MSTPEPQTWLRYAPSECSRAFSVLNRPPSNYEFMSQLCESSPGRYICPVLIRTSISTVNAVMGRVSARRRVGLVGEGRKAAGRVLVEGLGTEQTPSTRMGNEEAKRERECDNTMIAEKGQYVTDISTASGTLSAFLCLCTSM